MPTPILMPEIADVTTDGKVLLWLHQEGDALVQGQPLCRVQMDGEIQEVVSPADGRMLKILVSQGERALEGAILAWIGEPDEVWWDKQPEQPAGQTAARPGCRYRGFISPAVARLLQQYPVDLADVPASGAEGRVTLKDLQSYLAQNDLPDAGEEDDHRAPDLLAEGGETVLVPPQPEGPNWSASLLRRVDLTPVAQHRHQNQQALHFTYTVYFTQAILKAILEVPEVLSCWTPEGISQAAQPVLGFSIYQEGAGMVVPTFTGLERLSQVGIARVLKALAEKARTNCIQPVSPQPGTVTIVNYGAKGALWGLSAMNPSCGVVLAIGAVQQVPSRDSVEESNRQFVYLSLRYDSRALSACHADRFLAKIAETLENWSPPPQNG